MQQVGHAFSLDTEVLEASTQTWLVKLVKPIRAPRGQRKVLDSTVARLLNPHAPCLKVCPQCLREGNAIRLVWQTNWAVVCLRHEALLVDTCPACQQQIAANRSPFGIVAPADVCGNRYRGSACSQPLRTLSSVSARPHPRLIAAQRVLEAALAGRSQAVGGKTYSPFALLHELRTLLELVWIVWPARHLEHVPEPIRHTFIEYTLTRSRSQGSLDDVYMDRTSDARGSVALNAVGLPIALDWLELSSPESISAALTRAIQRSVFAHPRYPKVLIRGFERAGLPFNREWDIARTDVMRWMRRRYKLF